MDDNNDESEPDQIDVMLNDLAESPEVQEVIKKWEEDGPTSWDPEVFPKAPKPKIYGGTLSKWGVVFMVLMWLAIAASIVILMYDTVIEGAEEESRGETQWLYAYLAIGAILLFAILTVVDVLRIRRRSQS